MSRSEATAVRPPPLRRRWDRAFGAAYATALLASLVSAALTYVFVRAGANELNPVIRWLIAAVGFEAMIVVKIGVLVVCYWLYAVVSAVWLDARTVAVFAWLGALVNVLDAVHDVSVAVLAGSVPWGDSLTGVLLVLAMGVLGGLLRPSVPLAIGES